MPRAKEPDPLAGLFDNDHGAKRIAKMLNKAVERRIEAAARSVPKANVRLGPGGGRRAQKATLGKALAKAMGLRKAGRDKPSIRMSAPDTGGRSFHFEHSTVSKRAPGDGIKTSRDGSKIRGKGVAAAHLAYIERDGAVERLERIGERAISSELGPAQFDAGIEVAPRKRGRPSKTEKLARAALDKAMGEGWERGIENDPAAFAASLEGAGRAAEAQRYIGQLQSSNA